MLSSVSPGQKQNILTVVLEDYFHVGALSSLISPVHWDRFDSRFEKNTLQALDLLKRFDIKATFFVLGWIAERRPDLIAEVANQGHEIANYGFYHRNVRQMTRDEFRDDSRRSRDALEAASGKRVIGHRIPQGIHSRSDQWILEVLAEEGYVYDSSVFPLLGSDRSDSQSRFAHQHEYGGHQLWEIPHATFNCFGYLLPISGGNYFRQIPHTLLRHAVAHWHKTANSPYMMYFHVWELDPDQPRISAASFLARTRQYRKLDKMHWVLEEYFKKYKFGSIASYLGCDTSVSALPSVKPREPIAIRSSDDSADTAVSAARRPLSLVVPCYNERAALPYLANTLESVSKLLRRDYKLSFIFVDDASTDGTWDVLKRLFGEKENCRLVQHPQNRGVAAAILTGIRHADTEIVCSIDCDCSYDPHDLMQMVPLMTDGVDLVTASPYHPQGKVMNVPNWRLGLSRGASWLYGKVLRHKLSTYTSCFRVYRRSRIVDLQLKEFGYLGVAETLGILDLQGAHIIEFPATLRVRILGQSKMKVARTIVGHLKNLWRMRQMRRLIDRNGGALARTAAPDPPLVEPENRPRSISSKNRENS
jgi:polysaccharide deacetylase family protein (PEP-CTERM system associated)